MPRPKVDPANRQRSVIACLPCKSAKIRCDSKTPCTTCTKRSREDKCIYDPPPNDGASRRKRRSTTSTALSTSNGQRFGGSLSQHIESTHTPSADDDASIDDESQEPKSRMLLSSKFQKVYIGATSALSYLQFVRRIVQHRIGPCQFTQGEFNNFMLESNIASGSPEALVTLSGDEKTALVQAYLEGVSFFLVLRFCCPSNLSSVARQAAFWTSVATLRQSRPPKND